MHHRALPLGRPRHLALGAAVALLGWPLLAAPLTALSAWLRRQPLLRATFPERANHFELPHRLGGLGVPDRPLQLVREIAKFGIIGGICYVVQVGLFNALHTAAGLGPLTALVLSTAAAATCAYAGNRHWSFRQRARTGVRRELSLFFVLNAISLGLPLLCLGFSYYLLDLRGPLVTNISGNLVGTGLATLFRFWAYKRYVFLHPDHPRATAARPLVSAAADGIGQPSDS